MNSKNPLQKALDLSGNKLVEASAGTGKTFALSKRYSAILDRFAGEWQKHPSAPKLGVRNILVITFTRKAAAEMAGRIYSDLRGIIEADNPVESVLSDDFGENIRNAPGEYTEWLKSEFSFNFISTIDSFCSRIIREHSHLLGLDPNFRLEDEFLADSSTGDQLRTFLRSQSAARNEDLKTLLDSISLPRLNEYLNYLYNNKQFLFNWFGEFLEKSADHIWQDWIDRYSPEIDVEYFIGELHSIIRFVDDIADRDDAAYRYLSEIKSALQTLEKSADDDKKIAFINTVILPFFLTKDNKKYRSSLHGNQANWRTPAACKQYKAALKALIDHFSASVSVQDLLSSPGITDKKSIPLLKALIRLYRQFYQTQIKRKQTLNLMTFDDLVITAYELLSKHDKVRLKYARQFHHVLIDEFQDTNDLRWDIIKMICSDENGKLRDKGIFIVGDKKQSIYSFQQAEVEVINHAARQLHGVSRRPDEVKIRFDRNFRSSRNMVENTFNGLFPKIFPGIAEEADLKPFEVAFPPASYGKKSGESEAERVAADSLTPESCLIQCCYTPCDTLDENTYLPAWHTAMVAKKFLQWADECGFKENPAVAVLFRRFTKIQYYIDAFREFDIPCEIIGGRGLFEQQEAHDLLNLLSVLINPQDDMALIGILRSPVFCVSDDIIYMLDNSKSFGVSLYHSLMNNAALKPIADVLDRWRDLSKTLPLDRLLQSIFNEVLTEFSYIGEAGGFQRIANLDLLVNLVHSMSLTGMNLREVHEYLSNAKKSSDFPQAEASTNSRVQLLTIHKAKGLEFPAVIIPEMCAKPYDKSGLIAHAKFDDGSIDLGVALDDQEGEYIKTGLLNNINIRSRERRGAEERRLFYVAATRAKYRLALLGDIEEGKPQYKESWWGKFIKAPGFCPDTHDNDSWKNFHSDIAGCSVRLLEAETIIPTVRQDLSGNFKSVPWEPLYPAASTGSYRELTPHDLMKLMHRRDDKAQEFGNASSPGNNIPLAAGALFHRIAEKDWFDSARDQQNYTDFLKEAFPAVPQLKILPLIEKYLSNYLASELYDRIKQVPAKNVHKEVKIFGWLKSEKSVIRLSGRIDLLYRREEKWFCLDYKTDANKERLSEYRTQIQTYLWMLKQSFGIEVEGQIHYVHFGETIRVKPENSYFSRLNRALGEEFSPEIPPSRIDSRISANISAILQDNPSVPITIINKTKLESNDLGKQLSRQGLFRPDIQLTTLQEILIECESPCRRLSPLLGRFLTHKVVKDNKIENLQIGHIDLLASSLLNSIEWNLPLQDEFAGIEEDFMSAKAELGLFHNREIASSFLQHNEWDSQIVIVNGCKEFEPTYIDLLYHIQTNAQKYYLIESFDSRTANSPGSNARATDNLLPDTANKYYYIAATIAEEVENTAKTILSTPDWTNHLRDLVIAVSSMEMYVPVIKRVFASCGIPVTIFKNEPVLERPVVQLLLALVKILANKSELSWTLLSSIYLHPLMDVNKDYYELDKWCRRNGFEDYYRLQKAMESLPSDHPQYFIFTDAYSRLKANIEEDFIRCRIAHPFDLRTALLKILNKYKVPAKVEPDNVSSSALQKALDAVDHLLLSGEIVDFKMSLADFYYYFADQLGSLEIPTKKQQNGIEVLGYLDTLHLSPSRMFVQGMIEGNFPQTSNSLTYLSRPPFNYWGYNLLQLNHWLSLPSEIIFSAPLKNSSGGDLQPSTFLENLPRRDLPSGHSTSAFIPRRQFHDKYYGKSIIYDSANPRIIRHNQYLMQKNRGIFVGLTGKALPEKLTISPSGMDALLHCPMQYWFSKILRLQPLKFDEEGKERLDTGNIIHQTLCEFGEKGGFTLLKEDYRKAVGLLQEQLASTLEKFYQDPQDPLTYSRFRFYLAGLKEEDPHNLLIRLLDYHRDNLADFTPQYFEKSFGSDECEEGLQNIALRDSLPAVFLQGRIDKLSFDLKNQVILASDYKTGFVNLKDITENRSSQFPLYYLALQQIFPDKRIILAYERLKSPKKEENGISQLFGDIEDSDNTIPTMGKFSGSLKLGDPSSEFQIENFKSVCLKAIAEIRQGNFPLADSDKQEKACKYCDYAGLCRKDSVRY